MVLTPLVASEYLSGDETIGVMLAEAGRQGVYGPHGAVPMLRMQYPRLQGRR